MASSLAPMAIHSNGNPINTSNGTRIGSITAIVNTSTNDASFIVLNSGHSYTGAKVDEISSNVPALNSYITLRGFVSGTISSAKVLSTNATFSSGSNTYTDHIKVDKGLQPGDSGGGAIGGTADGGRTNCIVGINRATDTSTAMLVKGGAVFAAFN